MNLLFSTLLRNYSETLQFYNYQMGSDFSLVLQYIQHNYQTLSCRPWPNSSTTANPICAP